MLRFGFRSAWPDGTASESEAQWEMHMPAPKPGQRVRGSTTGRPEMALFDLLGRRWTLRVIWELSEETLSFRALRNRCDSMSTSVLNERLSELRQAEIVELRPDGYRLTHEGQTLLRDLQPLKRWARRWATRLGTQEAGRPGG
jgi:DNA-binding HxlR family transcriptional regulator